MGLHMGTDMGNKPTDMGKDIISFFFRAFRTTVTTNYATIPHSLSDQISSSLASGRDAAAFKSSKLTKPHLLQYPRHISARVDCAVSRFRMWDMISRPLLKTRSTATEEAKKY